MKSLLLGLCLTACSTADALPTEPKETERIERADVRAEAKKTVAALDKLLQLACYEASDNGRADICEDIWLNWTLRYKPMMLNQLLSPRDIGDHTPLSIWLAEITAELYAVLGPVRFEALHLDDLVIFNYGIPVFFSPYSDAEWCLEEPQIECKVEYSQHAVPLMGVTAYWTAWGVCMGATWGTAATWACAPIGMVAERVTVRRIAPKLSDRIYDKYNG